MIVHSDSELGSLLSGILALVVIIALSVSVAFAVNRQFRSALRVAGWTVAGMAGWIVIVTLISFASPQVIVKVGDSYCEDIRCIGINAVHAEANGAWTTYNLDVRLFSDAYTVKVSFQNLKWMLVDERGRRFPAIAA